MPNLDILVEQILVNIGEAVSDGCDCIRLSRSTAIIFLSIGQLICLAILIAIAWGG